MNPHYDNFKKDADKYGFEWGNLVVSRICRIRRGRADTRIIEINTPRESVSIYVTATGLCRVYNGRGRKLSCRT